MRLILLRFMVCIMLMYDTMGLVTGPQGGPPTPNNGLHFRAAVTAPALVMKACIYLSIYLCIYIYIYIYISTYIICMCTHTIYLYTYIYIYTHGVHLQNLNSLKPKPRGHEQLPRGRDSREARHHRFRGSGCRVQGFRVQGLGVYGQGCSNIQAIAQGTSPDAKKGFRDRGLSSESYSLAVGDVASNFLGGTLIPT